MKNLKNLLRIMLVGLLLTAGGTLAHGQEPAPVDTTTQDAATSLRSLLSDVQAKEAELQTRERQLDEDMRPENIERSLAGVGSTKPEELREQRRRQLESDKRVVRVQLDILAQSRTRLEAAIADADADAYRRSAQVNTPATQTQPVAQDTAVVQETKKVSAPKKQRRATRRRRAARRH